MIAVRVKEMSMVVTCGKVTFHSDDLVAVEAAPPHISTTCGPSDWSGVFVLRGDVRVKAELMYRDAVRLYCRIKGLPEHDTDFGRDWAWAKARGA